MVILMKKKKKKKVVCQDGCPECHFKIYFRAYVMMCIILIQNETQINNSMEWQHLLGEVKKIYTASLNVAGRFFFFKG